VGEELVLGETKVYVRKLLTDSWTDVSSTLKLGSPVELSAGKVMPIMFHESYAPGVPMGKESDYHKWWAKVTYTPDGGAEALVWYGDIEDSVINERAQRVEWFGSSIEAQLRRIRLGPMAYAENMDTGGNALPISLPVFNENIDDTGDKRRGLKSSNRYHFRLSDQSLELYNGGERTTDIAYVFGNNNLWCNDQVLDFLLMSHTGGDEGGWRWSPLTFKYSATTAAALDLAAAKETWDFRGKTLLDAVNALVIRSGPLIWWCDATEYDAGNQEYIDVKVGSRLWSDEKDDGAVTKHTLAVNDCMPAVLRRRVKDRVTEVTAVGAPVKVMFSVKYDKELPVSMKVTGPTYDQGWASGEQTAYLAADDDQQNKSQYAPVFLRFYIPHDQVDTGVSTWRRVFPLLAIAAEDYEAEIGDKFLEDATDTPTPSGFYARPRRLLSYNLSYPGYTYSTANDGTMPVEPTGAAVLGEHDPIMCWWVPDTITGGDNVIPVKGAHALYDQAGVYFSDTRLRFPTLPCLEMPTGTYDNWKNLIFTVSMETDQLAAVTVWDSESSDDQRRAEVIEMPQCEWWAAAGAALDIQPDGTVTWAYGVIRNDLPILHQAALNRYAELNQAKADGSVQPRLHGTIAFKIPTTVYDSNALKVGDFVQEYNGRDIHEAIMSVTHELRDINTASTHLTTYKALSRRDTP